jgi:NAD(P)-dependent dehydrogenase (short-subunit alcohol dehydrogenase family)
MTITLITGANKGLGRETARQLIAAGHTVYAGARDEQRGKEAAAQLGARFVLIDVTDDDSVAAAAAQIQAETGGLDVLINNAGIPGGRTFPGDVTAADVQRVYAVNVYGVIRVTHAFLPLLEASAAPVMVNVSSGLGSFGITTNPARMESQFPTLAYSSAKAAVNMLTSQYAKAFPRLKINAVDPGYTATDLNAHRGTQSIEEGAEIIVAMARIGADGPGAPTGGYFDRHGPIPW